MTTTSTPPLHPLVGIAAASVTLLSAVGIASMLGWLPISTIRTATPDDTAAVATLAAVSTTTSNLTTTTVAPPPPITTAPATSEKAAPPAPIRKVEKRKAPPSEESVTHKVTSRWSAPRATTSEYARPMPPPAHAGVPPDYADPPVYSTPPAPPPCRDCGSVEEIRQITHAGKGSGLGATTGAIVGGAIGSNFGQGHGRTLASIVGAVGGGVLGNEIEKKGRSQIAYQVGVRMQNGELRQIETATEPVWRVGDPVRINDDHIVPR